MKEENKEPIEELLSSLFKTAKTVWPDTIYGYRRIQHTYHSGPRNRKGYHTTVICGPPAPEITKEEYESMKDKGKKDSMDAFMGKSRSSYFTFERYIKEEGWSEKLKQLFDDALLKEAER